MEVVYFFGKTKNNKMKKFRKYLIVDGLVGSAIFYYFVRKIQVYYNVDVSSDGYGLAGAAWYGIGLGFIFGVKFIRIKDIISYLKK